MTIADLTGMPPRPDIKMSGELVVSDRNCGVEIEIENVSPNTMARNLKGLWDVTTDHSLRPARESAEIRSLPGGVCGKKLVDSIDAYCKLGLKENSNHFSWRTGLHVHVDVRDKIPEDLKVLGTMYALCEPFIFDWVGHGRWESRFSMPWWIVSSDMQRIADMQAPEPQKKVSANRAGRPTLIVDPIVPQRRGQQGFFGAAQHFSKYTSLNLAPTVRIGTIEFRHGQSTSNRKRILDYINLCLSFVEAAHYDGRPEQCSEMVAHYIKHGPTSFMRHYLGNVVADMIGKEPTGTPPLTESIIRASVNAAMHVAELDSLAQPVMPTQIGIDTLESVVQNRKTAKRRRLHRTLRDTLNNEGFEPLVFTDE